MSNQASNIMTTVENFNLRELDLENNDAHQDEESRQQADMLNIGEFVFNHITAE